MLALSIIVVIFMRHASSNSAPPLIIYRAYVKIAAHVLNGLIGLAGRKRRILIDVPIAPRTNNHVHSNPNGVYLYTQKPSFLKGVPSIIGLYEMVSLLPSWLLITWFGCQVIDGMVCIKGGPLSVHVLVIFSF